MPPPTDGGLKKCYLELWFFVYIYLEFMENNQEIDRNETLGQFLKSRNYSELFLKAYLVRFFIAFFSYISYQLKDKYVILLFFFFPFFLSVSDVWFNLVVLHRKSSQLFSFLNSFIFSKLLSSSGVF